VDVPVHAFGMEYHGTVPQLSTHLAGNASHRRMAIKLPSRLYFSRIPQVTPPNSSVCDRVVTAFRAVVYYVLFPLGVFCEGWIFSNVALHVGVVVAVPMVMIVVVHIVGMKISPLFA